MSKMEYFSLFFHDANFDFDKLNQIKEKFILITRILDEVFLKITERDIELD
jgi:hypothetical protein